MPKDIDTLLPCGIVNSMCYLVRYLYVSLSVSMYTSLYVSLLRTSLTCPLYVFTVLTVTMFFGPDDRQGGQRDRREAERHDVGSANIDA